MKYYPINEADARRAKEANSFSDYKEGNATGEYQAMVDHAYDVAEKCKATADPIYYEKLDALVDTYARKLAQNLDERNVIDARVPSILIAGGGNFPTRKKEKQNAARDQNMQEYREIEKLLEKMHSVGRGGISADDPDVMVKLHQKLEAMQAAQNRMKVVNAYYRKHKTLDGCSELTDQQVDELKMSMSKDWRTVPVPFPSFHLTNNLQNIKRVQKRLDDLKQKPADEWEFEGGKVLSNTEANRLQIVFDDKPSDEQRQMLKKRGFKWAPSQCAWQRQLTANALQAVKYIDFLQPISKV
ncbi:hypothetical protein [Paenibacillus hunanensis]|uniref:Uncharacterized protein n=1 Tax=Paenibacillus hunanensis TaxID=539262 RepID=A0ABU1IYQ2_9BACL|nr:hypothetical protein [Paenibacillus hunanensis]MDR6243492.1 hypothetical protein [Paenibacillus hunanensis]GGI98148.1 hypothetical protein GCM10008022_03540 [Paenibacillus hunanensis]